MIFLNEIEEPKRFVVVSDRVSFGGSECPCDHEGCNQDECTLKT